MSADATGGVSWTTSTHVPIAMTEVGIAQKNLCNRSATVDNHSPTRIGTNAMQLCTRLLAFLLLTLCFSAHSTIVRFDTTLGSFYVDLLEDDAPGTVANFLNYVRDGDYGNAVFHRSVAGFVLQAGGFTYEGDQFVPVPVDPPIVNEFGISNTRGTMAMAKTAENPDTATSQWFFNIGDNTEDLDSQNGGFTVFGRVLGDGMEVVDRINSLVGAAVDNGALARVPIYLHGRFTSSADLDASNFIFLEIEEVDGFAINTGLSGAWFNPATPGQGITLDIINEPGRKEVFAAWFTYDVNMPDENEGAFGSNQHRWFTASGSFNGNRTTMELFRNTGGIFNDPTATEIEEVGTLVIEFTDCMNAVVTVDFRTTNIHDDSFPIVRLTPDAFCEDIALPAVQ